MMKTLNLKEKEAPIIVFTAALALLGFILLFLNAVEIFFSNWRVDLALVYGSIPAHVFQILNKRIG